MKKFLVTMICSILAAVLIGCGGGGGTAPSIVSEAQAVVVVDACPPGDATAQLQGALDTAQEIILPACQFNVTTLKASRPVNIRGAGRHIGGTAIVFSGEEGLVADPGVVVDIKHGDWSTRGYGFQMTGVRIRPLVPGGGKHPFVMRTRPGFFISASYVAHNHFGGAGAQGVFLDNVECNKDGIFTTTFEDNFVENGFLAKCIGDSVHFIDNVVPDGFIKTGLPGYDLSWVEGAAESEITRGNITTAAGCIVTRNGLGLTLNHVWCESGGAPAGEQGAITMKNCVECTVLDTRVQPSGGAPYSLSVVGGAVMNVTSSKLGKGTQGHILFVNSREPALHLNRFDGGRVGKIDGADASIVH